MYAFRAVCNKISSHSFKNNAICFAFDGRQTFWGGGAMGSVLAVGGSDSNWIMSGPGAVRLTSPSINSGIVGLFLRPPKSAT